MKISKNAREKFNHFSQCKDNKRSIELQFDSNGLTALECFHIFESTGELLSTKEPELLTRALNGKEWHGLTVTMCAEDYVGRILFARELKENYPTWIRKDILGRAKQIALEQLGFIPKFVSSGEDFTTIEC